MTLIKSLVEDAIELLKQLIETPSISKEENKTADLLEEFFRERAIPFSRLENNIWVKNKYYSSELPTILLNSHHDTVKPNASWTYEPYRATIEDDKLIGLGSNDAGGPLVALIATFLYFYHRTDLSYNLILAATAEEEISGKNGIELLLTKLPPIEFGIVGEPTQMELAIAEKGLMVLDCVAKGVAGHAARNEGINAIYEAMKDILWFENYQFEKISPVLGPIKMSVTQIQAGTQHNVVPDKCSFVVDIRATECYTLEEVLSTIKTHCESEITPRSMRLRPSGIPLDHPFVQAGISLGKGTYGSPTLSDQALMPFTTVKIGPGDSARSHTANEFIFLSEIENGVNDYIKILKKILI